MDHRFLSRQSTTTLFSPDGQDVASASYDGRVITCDSFTGEPHREFGDPQASVVEVVAFIASDSADGNVRVWDTKSGEFIAEYRGHEEKVKLRRFFTRSLHLGDVGGLAIEDVEGEIEFAIRDFDRRPQVCGVQPQAIFQRSRTRHTMKFGW